VNRKHRPWWARNAQEWCLRHRWTGHAAGKCPQCHPTGRTDAERYPGVISPVDPYDPNAGPLVPINDRPALRKVIVGHRVVEVTEE